MATAAHSPFLPLPNASKKASTAVRDARVAPAAQSRLLRTIALLMFACAFAATSAQAQLLRFAGSTPVGSTAVPQTATVSIKASGTIGTVKVRTQGSDSYDFAASGSGTCSAGASYSAGQTCTLAVTFKPLAPGDRRGAVVLLDSNNTTLGMEFLDGMATGPVGTFIPGVINTVAGDANWIYAGDGGQASQSNIFLPFGVAVDAADDMFITDSSNSRIREVNGSTGIISTIGGTGVVGATGDGGPATSAGLSNPTSIALDPAGNVYFADNGNNAIRRIDAFSGLITTVAGRIGSHGYTGDGGAATAATLNSPNGICFDASGNLYIADTGNNVVRMLNAASGVITTVAGTGMASYTGDGHAATSATLNQPWGLTMSVGGVLYIADQANNVIRTVNTSEVIATIVGNGTSGFSGDQATAASAQLNVPSGVVIDVAGDLYIADSGNNRIRKVNASTGIITTIAGTAGESISGDGEAADQAGLYGPYGMALDGKGNLYIADVFHNRIREVSANAATLVFPAIRVGRVSAPLPQKLENDGNANLNVSTIAAVSNSAVDAATTTCTSTTSLAPLAQCVIGAEFAPQTLGTLVQGTINANSNASNSPGVLTVEGQVLDVDPTTLALVSNVNPSLTGSPVVFTVTATSAGTTPTGTVTLLDGTTVLGAVSLASGSASFTISSLTAGTHIISATYPGDSSNSSGTSPQLTQIVKDPVAATTTSISANPNPVIAGATLKLTATVTVSTAGAGTGPITGTVGFYDGATLIGTGAVANGLATVSVTTLSVGTHNLTAAYGGNPNYGTSTSAALSEKVTIATSSTVISTSINPSSADGSLTLTATATSNGGVPTGIVTFYDGSTSLGTATLTAGIAYLTITGTQWTVGNHILTASYAGDPSDTPGVSAPLTQVVVLATTNVTLTTSGSPLGVGATVIFTATLKSSGGIPSGTVQFLDGAAVVGSGVLNAMGVATLSTAALTVGSHNITAAYAGDSFDAGSTSPVLTEVIQNTTTVTTLTTSKNPDIYGDGLVITATVSGTGSIPSGNVNFLDAGALIGTAALNANGVATVTNNALTIGSHSLVASYVGDANHSPTVSPALTQSIVQSTTTSLTASSQQSFAGTAITWTAAVNGASGKAVAGTVALTDGTTPLATLTLNTSGGATYTSSALTPGNHSIVASFAGDANDAASASAAVATTVNIATTSTSLASSANPALAGAAVTFTANIVTVGGTPTGTVTFYDGTNLLGNTTLTGTSGTSGIAALTVATLTPGNHTVTARYVGDTDDQTSTSAAITEQIVQSVGVTLVSSANPSLLTDGVTFTVTVTNGSASAVPTGTVTLTDGGTAVGTATLSANGVASFTIASPALGTHTMVATYAGDTQNQPSISTNLIQTVLLRPTTSTFTVSSTAISAGQQIVMVSAVQGAGSRSPTGTVTFSSPTAVFGTAPINASGVATLTVKPGQGTYNAVSTYSGDSLFASSTSTPIVIIVGPTIEFTLNATPTTMTMKSGDHQTLTVSLTTAPTFVDTISLGCAGLPADATCTFSQASVPVSGGASKTLTLLVDTGNPLGAGATAKLETTKSTGLLACLFPAGLLLLVAGKKKRLKLPLGFLLALLTLGSVATLSGCASSFTLNSTPAGSYTFEIIGTGNSTGATQSTGIQLTVTK